MEIKELKIAFIALGNLVSKTQATDVHYVKIRCAYDQIQQVIMSIIPDNELWRLVEENLE